MPESRWAHVAQRQLCVGLLIASWMVMYGSTYQRLAETVWRTDEQGHGPIIFALAAYLLYRKRTEIADCPSQAPKTGGGSLCFGLLAFIFGHAFDIVILAVGSQIIVLASLFLIFKGWRGLRLAAFPILFIAFMVPLPAALVGTVTAPLKIAVSTVAASALHIFGYPVGRSGVTIVIGQYEMLVADACAGLNSMFTLEALGFLYLNIMGYSSRLRNLMLAIVIIPIAFLANVVRVITLILVTYYLGDEVGQGFAHGFAGMVLFIVALLMILTADLLIGKFVLNKTKHSSVPC